MKTEISIHESWQDLVFENRNKDYGAYFIRKRYPTHVAEAFAASLFFTTLLFGVPRLISPLAADKPALPENKIYQGIEITLKPPITLREKVIRPEVKHLESDVKKIVPFVTMSIVAHEDESDHNTEERGPGLETNQTGEVALNPEPTGTIGEGQVVSRASVLIDHAEVMPQYLGGMEAMIKFIQKHLKYPIGAKKLGTEGKVFVKFVVSNDGSVTGVEVIRGFSTDCDKEAVRVISMMPHWRPGMQNRMPVSVRMVLPIYFKLSD